MAELIVVLRNSFFSGFVCIGLAILKNVAPKNLSVIYLRGFVCSAIFTSFNLYGFTLIGGFFAACAVSLILNTYGDKNTVPPIVLIIPALYCITPGGALYNMFLAMFTFEYQTVSLQLIYILQDVAGIWLGLMFVDEIFKKKRQKTTELHAVNQ